MCKNVQCVIVSPPTPPTHGRHVSVPGYTSLDPNRPVKRPPPSRLHRNRAAAVRRQLAEAAPEDVAVHGGEEVTMR